MMFTCTKTSVVLTAVSTITLSALTAQAQPDQADATDQGQVRHDRIDEGRQPFGIAQNKCATKLRPEDVPIVRARQAAGVYDLPEGAAAQGPNVVPLTVHIVRRDDGSGGIPDPQVDQAIEDANDLWAGSGIQFCQYGPSRFIDSDFYFDLPGGQGFLLRQVDRVENTVNVYFVNSYGSLAGQSSFTFSDFQGVIMVNNASGTPWAPSILAHELGHYFDLFHTHETFFGEECVDGSNCDEAGDLLCDTPADPNLGGLVTPGCVYTGSMTGPCDGLPYAPDVTNFMSYSRSTCALNFTSQQMDRALATLLNARPELLDISCGLDSPCGPGAGGCLAANGTPGCEDGDCCALICAFDTFCCNNSWDSLCADEAIEMCGIAGNECEDAREITEGNPLSVILDNNSGSTGDDSSCGVNDELDEWFEYTATCSGTATAGMCTEFVEAQPTITVFDSCGGDELTCSAAPDPDCFFNGGANATWEATAGQTYSIRVSGESATQKSSFNGQLFVNCEGCGSADSGSCLESNGSPFCENTLCCQTICGDDPFCCDSEWDNICAGAAATECDSCGGDATGNCYVPNGSPYCDSSGCCDAVCAADPFCCDTTWDSLCSDAATDMCLLFPGGFPGGEEVAHIPLGSATLSETGEGIILEGFDSNGEPDGMLLALIESPFENSVLLPAVQSGQSAGGFLQIGALEIFGAVTPSDLVAQLPAVQLQAEVVSGQGMIISSEFNGSDAHRVQVIDGSTEVFDGPAPCLLVGSSTSEQLPIGLGAEARDNEIITHLEWEQPISIDLSEGPTVTGDTLVISTINNSIFDDDTSPDGNGQGVPDELLLGGGRVTAGGGIGSLTVTEEQFDVPGPACPTDFDFNGLTNGSDLGVLLGSWGQCADCPADLNGDNAVNGADLGQLLGTWGTCQ